MKNNKLVFDFLKARSIKDIQRRVSGELLEYSTERATYFYGNGELIVSPADESLPEQTYVVDIYSGKDPILVET